MFVTRCASLFSDAQTNLIDEIGVEILVGTATTIAF